jgi:hypothetical protein
LRAFSALQQQVEREHNYHYHGKGAPQHRVAYGVHHCDILEKTSKKNGQRRKTLAAHFLSCEQTSPSGKVSLTKISIHLMNAYLCPGNRVAETALRERGSRHRNDDYPTKKLLPIAVRKLMQNVSGVKHSETF